jgi:predicted nucleotidyltransferase
MGEFPAGRKKLTILPANFLPVGKGPRGSPAKPTKRHHGRKFRTSGSDIDVLVEFHPNHVPGLGFFAMEDELTKIFGRKVDLQTPRFLSRYIRDQVIADAEVHYVAS